MTSWMRQCDVARQWAIAVGATFLLHYAWEMLQAPWFEELAKLPLYAHLGRCGIAAIGDVLIAGSAYALTALLFRSLRWPFASRWFGPALVWIASGMAVTVVFEHWAVTVGRWSYTEAMPTIAGIGLLPVLQWIIVPTMTLLLVRLMAFRHARRSKETAQIDRRVPR